MTDDPNLLEPSEPPEPPKPSELSEPTEVSGPCEPSDPSEAPKARVIERRESAPRRAPAGMGDVLKATKLPGQEIQRLLANPATEHMRKMGAAAKTFDHLHRAGSRFKPSPAIEALRNAVGALPRLQPVVPEALLRLQASQPFHVARWANQARGPFALLETLNRATLFPTFGRLLLPDPDVLEYFQNFPKRVRSNLIALAKAGWYMDRNMPMNDVTDFEEKLNTRSPEAMDAELADYFRRAMDRIEADLIENHTTRAALLREAFDNHRAGRYASAILLLLSQADGVALELTQRQLFSGGGLNVYAKRFQEGSLERAYLDALNDQQNPISTSSKQRRAQRGGQLNRHAAMHGEDLGYGTEVNGLRAISHLNFVSHVISVANDEIQLAADAAPLSAADGDDHDGAAPLPQDRARER